MAGDGQGGSSGGGMKREVVRMGVERLERKKKTFCAGDAWQANGSATVTGVGRGGVKTEGMLQQGVVGVASQTAWELLVMSGVVVDTTEKTRPIFFFGKKTQGGRVVGERAGNVDGGGSGKRDKERGASARGRGSSDRKCGQVSRGGWRRGGVDREGAWVRRGGG